MYFMETDNVVGKERAVPPDIQGNISRGTVL